MSNSLLSTQRPDERRYDLDWIRVIAFAVLIFYHVGMFYVDWDWHVKSTNVSTFLQPTMRLLNPWRLSLLFLISGVAMRFLSDKMTAGAFARSRLTRLGIPLLFGVVVIVAPQSYFELLEKGEIQPGLLHFWREYLWPDQTFSIITPTWNHLWYVAYLLTYTLLILPAAPLLRRIADPVMRVLAGSQLQLLLLPAVPFIAFEILLNPHFPTTNLLWGDWAHHAHRVSIFLLGYMAAKCPTFWRSAGRAWPLTLGSAIALAALFLLARGSVSARQIVTTLSPAVGVYYAWFAILALLGLAQRFLNRPSSVLSYLTTAIFPYFILHQTIIIVFGYWITRQGISTGPEFLLVVVVTVAGCASLYELIRRIAAQRPLFGLPWRARL